MTATPASVSAPTTAPTSTFCDEPIYVEGADLAMRTEAASGAFTSRIGASTHASRC